MCQYGQLRGSSQVLFIGFAETFLGFLLLLLFARTLFLCFSLFLYFICYFCCASALSFYCTSTLGFRCAFYRGSWFLGSILSWLIRVVILLLFIQLLLIFPLTCLYNLIPNLIIPLNPNLQNPPTFMLYNMKKLLPLFHQLIQNTTKHI